MGKVSRGAGISHCKGGAKAPDLPCTEWQPSLTITDHGSPLQVHPLVPSTPFSGMGMGHQTWY